MMQLVSKKVIAFNMLLLNFSISFGFFNQGHSMVCNDILLILGANGDGKVKNNLRQVNKFMANSFSINNDVFLLQLNKELLTEVDIQKILLKALWRDDKKDQEIVECYKRYYNQNEAISLKNFFGDNKFILEDNFFKSGLLIGSSSITFDEIKDSKKLLLDNGIFKEFFSLQKGISQALQVGVFCGDIILVQKISKQIINIFNEMSALSIIPEENYIVGQLYNCDQHIDDLQHAYDELSFFKHGIDSTNLLLLKLMYLNKKEMFQTLVDANPLNINEWTYIVEYFQKDEIETIDNNVNKAEYIEILEKQLKKTVKNPKSKIMNNGNRGKRNGNQGKRKCIIS